MTASGSKLATFEEVGEALAERWNSNRVLRRNLPDDGRLRLDRQLPFLCVYRAPPDRPDPGTQELVTTEAAYLIAAKPSDPEAGLSQLVRRWCELGRAHFARFLVIEVWAEHDASDDSGQRSRLTPSFQIVAPPSPQLETTVARFERALDEIIVCGQGAQVTVRQSDRMAPPGLKPLAFDETNDDAGGCHWLGLAIRPVYRGGEDGPLYPVVLQSLRRQLAVVFRKVVFAFTGAANVEAHGQYQSLGPSALAKAARLVDQQLCDVSESFDFLLQVTPVNAQEAWKAFRDGGCRQEPVFRYRPLPYHPGLLKRQLFSIGLERIEDPTLGALFSEKQDELDHQLVALRDLGSERFLYASFQLYGLPDQRLQELAASILEHTAGHLRHRERRPAVHADELAARAREEIDFYHQQTSAFNGIVEVSNAIASGVMVARDRLYVSETASFPVARIESILHHEVGTHLLTYFNGRAQRFRQLYAGLAGCEELQEGLAVLAEYLVGGLNVPRVRTLAGRVVAVQARIEGAAFADTYHRLHEGHGFPAARAFATTLRAYRGGGLTKDIIYLRGLNALLEYLKDGSEIEPLYVGKIGLQHLSALGELRRRGIVSPPAILPRFWSDPALRDRLEACRGRTIVELLEASA